MAATTSTGTAVRTSGALVRSIILAGLIVGVLGSIDQVIFFNVTQQTTPMALFQYIASALLGPAAFTGGVATALVGLLLHFVISFVVAAVFLLAASRLAFLRRATVLSGFLYGVGVFVVMNILIVPLSLAPKLAFSVPLALNAIISALVLVGMPIALVARRMSR
jgi:uncharacterized membrane protein YagU involved in acid resistance